MTGVLVLHSRDRTVEAVSTRLGEALAGRSPDAVVAADAPHAARRIAGADLLVVGTRMTADDVDPAIETLLRRAQGLTDTVVVLVAVGPWPAAANRVERRLLPIVLHAGARCVSPALVVDRDSAAALQSYSRHWRAVIAHLLPVGPRAHRVPA